MVPPHESITLVDASGTLINHLEGWGLEHQGLGLCKGCILRRGEGHSKKLRSCFMGDSSGSGECWWELRNPHRQMPEKGSGIRKIGYYLFQPANPTTKMEEVSGLTHMSQHDYVPVSSPCISETGNMTKDFGRQPIAWHQLVYTRSNQVEDFKSLLLKKTELIYIIHQS